MKFHGWRYLRLYLGGGATGRCGKTHIPVHIIRPAAGADRRTTVLSYTLAVFAIGALGGLTLAGLWVLGGPGTFLLAMASNR